MNNQLKDRVYIVTGGSKGFGLAIAKILVAEGANVGLVSRGQEALNDAVAIIGSDNAFGVAADVGSPESVTAAFSQIKAHFGRLDGVVNNAGMARPCPIKDLVEEEVLQQFNTNFWGTVFSCQAAVPLLKDSDNPRIVNISSASAVHTDEMSHLSIYASSKAAVERFTKDLRTELQKDKIGVTCLRPGAAGTNFADDWNSKLYDNGLKVWTDYGTYMDVGMEVEHVASSVAHALSLPPGVAIDLLEIRPNLLLPKADFLAMRNS